MWKTGVSPNLSEHLFSVQEGYLHVLPFLEWKKLGTPVCSSLYLQRTQDAPKLTRSYLPITRKVHSNLSPKPFPLGERLQTLFLVLGGQYPGGRARCGRGAEKREWRQGEVNSGAKEAPKIWSLIGWKEARIRFKVKGPWLGSGKQSGSRKPSRRKNLATNMHWTLLYVTDLSLGDTAVDKTDMVPALIGFTGYYKKAIH